MTTTAAAAAAAATNESLAWMLLDVMVN